MEKQRRLKVILAFFFVAISLQISNCLFASEGIEENKNYRFSMSDLYSEEVVNLYDIEDTYIPRKFSLKDVMQIPVANQENLGLCETFATVKSIETNYALKTGQYIDLSERYLDYMMSTDFYSTWRKSGVLTTGSNRGSEGDASLSSEALTFCETFGVPTEEDVPYKNYSQSEYKNIENAKPAIMVRSTVLFPNIQNINEYYTKQGWLKVLKSHIMNYGSVCASIATPRVSSNYNESTYALYDILPKRDDDVGHSISIVGWDDDYPKENFKIKPAQDGAFLCLNSWGEEWGNQGYFYISYYDVNLFNRLIGVIDTKLPTEYNVHTYDQNLFSLKGFTSGNASAFGIKYKRDKKNEYLTHITAGIGGYKENVYTAKIKYYVNPYDSSFDLDKMVYLGETNSIANGFMSNFTLDEPIKIQGESFSIMFVLEGNLKDIFCSYSKYDDGSLVSGNMYCYIDDAQEWIGIDFEFPVYAFTISKNENILKGDVNKDYYINSTDAAIVLDKYKDGNLTDEDFELCDMNDDKIINSTDAAIILDIYKNQ